MPKRTEVITWMKQHKIKSAILAYLLFSFIVAIAIASNPPKSTVSTDETVQKAADTPDKPVEPPVPDPNASPVSLNAAREYCQNADNFGAFLDIEKTDFIRFPSREQYFDSVLTDEDGKPLWILQWHGEDKRSDEIIRFVCMIGGSDEAIKLHRMVIDGVVIYEK